MRLRTPLLLSILLLLSACDDGTTYTPSGPAIALETQVPDSTLLEAGVNEATAGAARGTRSSSMSPAQLASLGTIPAEATPGVDLYRVVAGGRTALQFDVDGDGAVDEVDVFQATGGPVYLAWKKAGQCHLVFSQSDVSWYIEAACEQDGGVACQYTDSAACVFCDAEYCAPCAADADDASTIACEEVQHPEPDVGVEVETDIGTPDEDVTTSDVAVDAAEDVVEDTAPPTDVVEDVPTTTTGECNPACLSEWGVECCLACDCVGSGSCVPVCSSGFQWDCGIGCCFSYETFQCEGEG